MKQTVSGRFLLAKLTAIAMLYTGLSPLYVLPGSALMPGEWALITLLPLLSVLLTYGAGCVFGRLRKPAFILAIVLTAAAYAALLLAGSPVRLVLLAPSIFMMLAGMSTMSGPLHEEWTTPQIGVGVGVQLAGLLAARMDVFTGAGTALGWYFSVYLLMSVFFINRKTVAGGQNTGRAAGILGFNRRLLTLFCVVAIPVANFKAVRDAVVGAGRWLVRIVYRIIMFIAGLLTVTSTQTDEGGTSSGLPDMGAEINEPSAFAQIMQTVITVVAIAALAALTIYILYKVYRKLRGWLAKLWERLQSYSQKIGMGYEDRSETIFRWDDLSRGMKERWSQYLRRTRAPAWGKLNAREKVRRIYAVLLTRCKQVDPTLTVREALLKQGMGMKGESAAAFAALYDEARYSDHPISELSAQEMRQKTGV